MRLHFPQFDKPHRCNNCHAVLTHKSANEEYTHYRWRILKCWQCGDWTLPPILAKLRPQIRFRIWKWKNREMYWRGDKR